MVQTTNRFFDEVARLMNDAAGVAQGVRREFETLFRSQAERILRDLDLVQREEFEAVKDMASLAREENEALKARIAALESKTGGLETGERIRPAGLPTCHRRALIQAVFKGKSSPALLVFRNPRRYKRATAAKHRPLAPLEAAAVIQTDS